MFIYHGSFLPSVTKFIFDTDLPMDLVGIKNYKKDENAEYVPTHSPKKDDVVLIPFTTGSTGNPKGAILTYELLKSQLDACEKLTVEIRKEKKKGEANEQKREAKRKTEVGK